MKYPFIVLVICILLASCTNAPSQKSIELAVAQTPTTQPSNTVVPSSTKSPSPSATRTQAATATSLPSATETQTETSIPSLAETPTPVAGASLVIIIEVNKREEWVDIRNTGDHEVDLTGWSLVSEKGNQACSLAGVIGAGETLRVWSQAAQGEGYSCGYGSPIWNNSEADPAVLFNAEGMEVSRK